VTLGRKRDSLQFSFYTFIIGRSSSIVDGALEQMQESRDICSHPRGIPAESSDSSDPIPCRSLLSTEPVGQLDVGCDKFGS